MARTTEDTVRQGFGTASDVAQRSTEQFVQLFSLSGKQTEEAAGRAAEGLQAVAQSSTVLVGGLQEVSREWFEMTQNRLQKNIEAFTALAQCRSLQDLVAAQTSLVRDNLELTLANSQRLTRLSVGVIEEATRTIAVQPEDKRERLRRAA